MPKYYLLTLGCAKNTVDSQGMATLLERAGYRATDNPRRADLLIVNTCGFIAPAREESLEVIRELAKARRKGQKLLVAGCWAQRDPQAILQAVPEVDGLLGTRRWMDILEVVRSLERASRPDPLVHVLDAPLSGDGADVPYVAIQGASAYLKIADGCSRPCAFCAIPLIKGPAVSRPLERVLEDAAFAAAQGVKELNLIAQDTTAYGRDLGMEDGLATLLEQLVERVPKVPWIRVLYAFPGAVTPRLIDVMARYPQVLPYLDLPLQHAHPAVLRRMRRPADVGWVRRTVAQMRERIPDLVIRTTFIVGYPGETEEEFGTLLRFVEEMAFDRVGVFVYSHEEGTEAARLTDNVPPEVKEERRGRLMELQQAISLAKNRALVGKTLDVLVEGYGDGISVGRSYRDAPEIDGLVLVQGELPVGEIVPVRVTAALEYDLIGEPEKRADD
ncbi:MAG: 30S ribosomal protein S12 methylthiotransferase RimO [Anaerolineae bacterium]|nr:30S ribosomal protein S12 methylthiotransferase RimO [Anaerolineae bacterium]MCX8068650.1 30S ribosomal protein S12 methylthiotransferase RimO [Anaerolineae bacterium]MDW7991486.1 30S ribosomal protein S12 methylthiotransferase RimO [Anaerolineae bacterium]